MASESDSLLEKSNFNQSVISHMLPLHNIVPLGGITNYCGWEKCKISPFILVEKTKY